MKLMQLIRFVVLMVVILLVAQVKTFAAIGDVWCGVGITTAGASTRPAI